MNSPKKFRFWCKGTSDNLNFNKKGWWTYPNFLLNKYFAHLDIFESEDFIACQYTGLKDKNGQEIYEGDILRGENLYGFDGIYFGNVRYVPCRYQCFVKYPEGGCGGIILDEREVVEHSLVVIGNIYENPELLS